MVELKEREENPNDRSYTHKERKRKLNYAQSK